MGSEFLTRLFTPSPVMHWLLVLFPAVVAVAGLTGIAARRGGARRLTLLALIVLVWLWLPVSFADPLLRPISVMVSVLLWLSLLAAWAQHVWNRLPNPVWAHGWVLSHLVTILIACIVALVRAIQG